MIKAPKDLSDEKAWFWYNVRWYCFCVIAPLIIGGQLWVLYRLVTK